MWSCTNLNWSMFIQKKISKGQDYLVHDNHTVAGYLRPNYTRSAPQYEARRGDLQSNLIILISDKRYALKRKFFRACYPSDMDYSHLIGDSPINSFIRVNIMLYSVQHRIELSML